MIRVKSFSIIIPFLLSMLMAACSSSGGSSGNSSGSLIGVVQKGPFIQNSQVLISELNPDLTPNGRVFPTQTIDDFGNYSVKGIATEFVEVTVTGYYYNENSGNISDNPLTLSALVSTTSGTANINVLTTLTKDRIKYLMNNQGASFIDARHQAAQEVLSTFSIQDTISSEPAHLDISQSSDENGILLAISILLQGSRSTGEVQELMAKISSDIASRGSISDNAGYITSRLNNTLTPSFDLIDANLIKRYANLDLAVTLPDYRKFIKPQYINSGPIVDATLSMVQYYLVDNWTGTVTTPGGLFYHGQLRFNTDRSYSVRAIDYSPVFEYGLDDDSPYKTYSIDSMQADGKAEGTIVITWFWSSSTDPGTSGSLRNIYFADQFKKLHFEFWHFNQQNGPIVFDLTRDAVTPASLKFSRIER